MVQMGKVQAQLQAQQLQAADLQQALQAAQAQSAQVNLSSGCRNSLLMYHSAYKMQCVEPSLLQDHMCADVADIP